VNCVNGSTTLWGQTFSYDPFGNISKTATVGTSFLPIYVESSNRYSSVPGCTRTYDGDGDLTDDCMHTYTWQADGAVASVDTVSLTYDALGRTVEQARGSSCTEIVYTPGGSKLALMNGATVQDAFIPLPGGGTAVYTTGSSVAYYRHADWLGSSRLASTPIAATTVYADTDYAPFGESYGTTGTLDLNFTGLNQDTVPSSISGLYDFMFREYNPQQSRWISPDPAGIGAVNLKAPQTWNRYAYVSNGPVTGIDSLGLINSDIYNEGLFDDSCSINGSPAGCGAMMALGEMGGGGETGIFGSGDLNPVNIPGKGFAIPSITDEGINWSFSFNPSNYTFKGVTLTSAALVEILGLPADAATPLAARQQAALAAALGDVFHRLKNDKCAAFYGGHGADTLQSYGQSITFGPQDSPNVGGTPNDDHTGMILNSDPNGAFLSPPSAFYGAVGATQVQGFMIAHELAHNLVKYTGFFTNDSTSFGQAGSARQTVNNLRLSYNCY
jgi:RHS repeat-associated protein